MLSPNFISNSQKNKTHTVRHRVMLATLANSQKIPNRILTERLPTSGNTTRYNPRGVSSYKEGCSFIEKWMIP